MRLSPMNPLPTEQGMLRLGQVTIWAASLCRPFLFGGYAPSSSTRMRYLAKAAQRQFTGNAEVTAEIVGCGTLQLRMSSVRRRDLRTQ